MEHNCPVRVGDTLPSLTLKAFWKGESTEISLDSFRGKWLVLFFYPADFTFVCPTELEELAEKYADFVKNGAEVCSVSCDTHWVHKAWHDASPAIQKIAFPMLADPSGALAKAFGVYLEKEGVALRGSFLVDPQGVVQALTIHADGIGRSAHELYRTFLAAKFVAEHGGQVCPASWEPGKDTLSPSLSLVGKI